MLPTFNRGKKFEKSVTQLGGEVVGLLVALGRVPTGV